MCLEVVYRREEKKEALAELPNKMAVWKVVCTNMHPSQYSPYHFRKTGPYKAGQNRTGPKHCGAGYNVAYHFYRHKASAKRVYYEGLQSPFTKVIRCKVDKKNIVAIGEQWGALVIVAKEAWFPKYKPKKKTG